MTVLLSIFHLPDRILEESIFVRYDIQNISGELYRMYGSAILSMRKLVVMWMIW